MTSQIIFPFSWEPHPPLPCHARSCALGMRGAHRALTHTSCPHCPTDRCVGAYLRGVGISPPRQHGAWHLLTPILHNFGFPTTTVRFLKHRLLKHRVQYHLLLDLKHRLSKTSTVNYIACLKHQLTSLKTL